jgi:hypothetical protein
LKRKINGNVIEIIITAKINKPSGIAAIRLGTTISTRYGQVQSRYGRARLHLTGEVRDMEG